MGDNEGTKNAIIPAEDLEKQIIKEENEEVDRIFNLIVKWGGRVSVDVSEIKYAFTISKLQEHGYIIEKRFPDWIIGTTKERIADLLEN